MAKNWIRPLSSIKLAVVIIVLLAVIAAVGTIFESKYDAEYAQKMVYHSWEMNTVLVLLSINLIAVMISRWPWKPRHSGFVLAHIGILILLAGSVMTQKMGVDGTMTFHKGEIKKSVTTSNQTLSVYATFDGSSYQRLASETVDFLSLPPPLTMNVGENPIEVVGYIHFAARESEIQNSDHLGDGPALRINLENAFVNQTEWIRRDARKPFETRELGPARIVIAEKTYEPTKNNEAVFYSEGQFLRYEIFDKLGKRVQSGKAQEGDVIKTSWAKGMNLRILRYFEHSKENVTYHDQGSPNNQTSPALHLRFLDKDHWLGLNSELRIFTKNTAYQIVYTNEQLGLPFDLKLNGFRVGHYPGTKRASSYESDVLVDGQKPVTISMNEPLKHGGFTFYQSSFEEDMSGQPVISILSVNYDPGRGLKYFGSFLMVLGSVMLFYFKHRLRKAKT